MAAGCWTPAVACPRTPEGAPRRARPRLSLSLSHTPKARESQSKSSTSTTKCWTSSKTGLKTSWRIQTGRLVLANSVAVTKTAWSKLLHRTWALTDCRKIQMWRARDQSRLWIWVVWARTVAGSKSTMTWQLATIFQARTPVKLIERTSWWIEWGKTQDENWHCRRT